MSYYPILKAPGCTGWTTLCNFPPNNWETTDASDKYINLTWCSGSQWKSRNLGTLRYGKMRTISLRDVSTIVPNGVLPLLSLSNSLLPEVSSSLPHIDIVNTLVPRWRSTLGLSSETATTAYQGEIDPFPATGTFLSFAPFLQFGQDIENYLLFLNIEQSAVSRRGSLEIYDSRLSELKNNFEIANNSISVISLDNLGFDPASLPVVVCRSMAGIPLFFSRTVDGAFLSMEHTHPPASYVVHGQRWEAQKLLKKIWFTRTA
jgi:hypothetical protein